VSAFCRPDKLTWILLAVALIALLVNLFSGSDGETAAETATDDTATSESIPLPAIEELVVADVVYALCAGLEDSGFDCV